MIKLALQNSWQPEDDLSAIVDKWIAEENAKIPAEVRENLREYFPHIGISPDEADLIPASVAHHITMHSLTYRKYLNSQNKSIFEKEFFVRLQALYTILDFYTAFVETVSITKRANVLCLKLISIKVKSGLLEEKSNLMPKTRADEELLTLLVEIENSLLAFESIVPVETVKYIGHVIYQIPSDTLSTYRTVEELVQLSDLKKQAEELFGRYGYIQTGRSTFVSKHDKKQSESENTNLEAYTFKQRFLVRLQALYILLEFYTTFIESLIVAKRTNDFYLKSFSIKVKPDLPEKEVTLCPKTKEEEQMLAFLVEIEKSLRLFENVMPVEIARYIDYDIYQISGDSLSTYSIAAEMFGLLDLKKQAEGFFAHMGKSEKSKDSLAPERGEN
ncbi:MAG: hypothetical protein FWE19_02420 [Oscillospiraceae bacterium]|nr:hypothetical protein [Oscillospiraceae bacterium]